MTDPSARRRWLTAAALGAAAAAAGAGWAIWRSRQDDDDGVGPLWAMVFDTPGGGRLPMDSLRGGPLVVNFWATWCPPCVREMPALDRFARDFAGRGWQVVGVAADTAEKVREFLARTPVSYPIGLAGFGGIELSRQLGNPGGGLPFTVLVARTGQLAHRHIGELQHDQLARWAEGMS